MDARASPHKPVRLKKRRDFLAAARARSWSTPSFVLQARRRKPHETAPLETDAERARSGGDATAARIGFTASKKVGDAVTRNRAKRRLRALVDELAPSLARPDWDYVLIARAETTVSAPFDEMRLALRQAFENVHDARREPGGRRRGDKKSDKTKAARADAPGPKNPEARR